VQTHERRRPISDFTWWGLDAEQIRRYTSFMREQDVHVHWLFVIGETRSNLGEVASFNERVVLHRDIYLVPWNACETVQETPSGWLHLGLSRLQREHEFKSRSVRKGTLHYDATLEEIAGKYFQK
jgi:hypothetical protein